MFRHHLDAAGFKGASHHRYRFALDEPGRKEGYRTDLLRVQSRDECLECRVKTVSMVCVDRSAKKQDVYWFLAGFVRIKRLRLTSYGRPPFWYCP